VEKQGTHTILILVAAASLLVSACAARWARPNTTESESWADVEDCRLRAARTFPPQMVYTPGALTTQCTTNGGVTQCTSTPAQGTQDDTNALSRYYATNDCLRSKGYSIKFGK
jgi:hypothetical protein